MSHKISARLTYYRLGFLRGVFPRVNGLALCFTLTFAPASWAFWWSTDMADQVSVKAQETQVRLPVDSIPLTGVAVALPIGEPGKARELAGLQLQNPIPMVTLSIARGRVLFQRHCQSCHGALGRGPGPVGQKFQPTPFDLSLAMIRQQPDGRIYYTISRGSVFMPGYGFAIPAEERWHLVNYIKAGGSL